MEAAAGVGEGRTALTEPDRRIAPLDRKEASQ
jgi:hypothetical protein